MRDIQVLLVDDKSSVRYANKSEVNLAFQKLGLFGNVSFLEAEGPNDDLNSLILDNSFDMAIVDYMLVDGDGFDVLDSLAPHDPLCETKIIFYTAQASSQVIDIALKAIRKGAHSFVRKGKDNLEDEITRTLLMIWKEHNRAMVGSFVDERLRKQLADPDKMNVLLNGCKVEKGFLFCDITSSTPFIQDLQGTVAGNSIVGPVIRKIFSWMGNIIQENGGIIDKFIGDELMAYFGDSMDHTPLPDSEVTRICNAMVNSALVIRNGFQDKLNEILDDYSFFSRPAELPNVKCIINFDYVIWGILGSERFMDLTIITDGVIRAARVMQHKQGRQKLIGAGDIFLMERVAKSITQDRYRMDDPMHIDVRDFNKERLVVQKVTEFANPAT